jgi:hypothetical protein
MGAGRSIPLIGVVLLAIAFQRPGPCANRSTEIVGDAVVTLTWPVGVSSEVYQGKLLAKEWMHAQACEVGGTLGGRKG